MTRHSFYFLWLYAFVIYFVLFHICYLSDHPKNIARKFMNTVSDATLALHVGNVIRQSAQWRSQPDNLVMLCKCFCVYRPYKESISKQMNNDDLNLHGMTNCRAGFATESACLHI